MVSDTEVTTTEFAGVKDNCGNIVNNSVLPILIGLPNQFPMVNDVNKSPLLPVGPVSPVGPVNPVSPVNPVAPVGPVYPVCPVAPVYPLNPM